MRNWTRNVQKRSQPTTRKLLKRYEACHVGSYEDWRVAMLKVVESSRERWETWCSRCEMWMEREKESKWGWMGYIYPRKPTISTSNHSSSQRLYNNWCMAWKNLNGVKKAKRLVKSEVMDSLRARPGIKSLGRPIEQNPELIARGSRY